MPKLFTSLLLAVNLLGHICACADEVSPPEVLASVRVGAWPIKAAARAGRSGEGSRKKERSECD